MVKVRSVPEHGHISTCKMLLKIENENLCDECEKKSNSGASKYECIDGKGSHGEGRRSQSNNNGPGAGARHSDSQKGAFMQ